MRVHALVVAAALTVSAGAALSQPASRHVLIRTSGPVTEADRAELARKGIVVQEPAANGEYLVRVSDASAADERVVAIAPLTAEEKIQPSAYREAARAATWATVKIRFHDDVAFDDAREAILAAGGALDDILATGFSAPHEVTAKIASPSLAALAADDRVLLISGPRRLRIRTDNSISAQVSHVTELQAAPYGLSGDGVSVSLFELAAGQATHPEFSGRLTVLTTGGTTGDQSHATHTAGTIGASGINPLAKGMAPKSRLFQFRVTEGANGEPVYQTTKNNELASRGVVADNNSWGYTLGWSTEAGESLWIWDDSAEYFGAYDHEYTAPLDQISRERNVLFVHSSGNSADEGPTGSGQHRHRDSSFAVDKSKIYCYSQSGNGTDCQSPCTVCETAKHHAVAPFDTMSLPGAAKNALTVGAVSTTGEILALSSRGPAKDGRVKPEVVARGLLVVSSVPTDSYGTKTGTSMAAPVVTGVAALLTEQWRRTFATTPKPEELKAVIIAGADDVGAPGPDYTYGFGLVNAKASVDLVIADHGDHRNIRSTSIAQGGQYELPIVVRSPQNVRVVLQWADPPVFLSEQQGTTASALVNDLDVKVIGPGGTVSLPYVLDKNNPSAPAVRGVNSTDNTEMVEIANAAPGAYRVVVAGANVRQGPQSVVLVTNARAARECRDNQEPNDSSSAAWGNIVTNSKIYGGFCADGDVDYYKFAVTTNSTVLIDVENTGDTALRATLIAPSKTATVDVPAYSSRSLQLGTVPPGTLVVLKFEPAAPRGVEPDYAFTPFFGSDPGVRRRSTRH